LSDSITNFSYLLFHGYHKLERVRKGLQTKPSETTFIQASTAAAMAEAYS